MKNLFNRPPSKRLRILQAIQQLLAGINTAEGYAFDLADKVHINRLLFGQDVVGVNGTLLSIIEAPRPDFAFFAGEGNFMRADKWTLMIQGVTPDDKTANSELWPYYLEQDVEVRLKRISEIRSSGSGTGRYPEHHMLGGMISSVEIAPPVIRPPEAQISSHNFFYLPIRLGVAVEIGE